MLRDIFHNKWVQASGLLLVAALVVLVCYAISAVLVTLFFAFLVAYVLDPVVDFMERRRIPRPVTVTAIAAVAVVVVATLPMVLVPYVINQADRLTQPSEQAEGDSRLAQWGEYVAKRLPLDDMVRYVGWAEPNAEDFDAREVIAERLGRYVKESALGFLREHAQNFFTAGTRAGSAAAAVFTSVWRWVVAFLYFAGNVALFAFVVAYLLNDFDKIVAAAKDLIPHRWRPRTLEIVGKIDFQVHSFLRGELVVCLILGVLYGIGFSVSEVPFAIPIAVLGGLSAFVPYVGAMVAVVPAVLLALLEHGAAWNVLGALVTVVTAQSLEGWVLTPNIVGGQVGLSPLWVILSLMVFATLMGFPGLLLAVPVAAALKVLVVEALGAYKRSALFEPLSPPVADVKAAEEPAPAEATDA